MRRPAFWAGCAVIFGEILGFIIYEQQQSGRIYVGIIALVVGLVGQYLHFLWNMRIILSLKRFNILQSVQE